MTVLNLPTEYPGNSTPTGYHGGRITEAAPAGNRGLTTTTDTESTMAVSQHTHTLFPEPTTGVRPNGVADPRPDGCPSCDQRGNEPREVGYAGTGYYATYSCTCGRTWWTGWAYEPAEAGA